MEERERESEKEIDFVREWNSFLEHMMAARDIWNALSEVFDAREPVDDYPLRLQEAIARFGAGRFEIIVPDMIIYSATSGGFEEMLCEEPRSDPEKGDKKTERKEKL